MNKRIENLHYLTQDISNYSHQELTQIACKEGVKWIQLRVKEKAENEYLSIAKDAKAICERHNVKLIINDNVNVAKAVNANGVHLGKTDMRPSLARKILGNECIIGGTANTFEDIQKLTEEGVDYIGLGPYEFTKTKKNLSPTLGIEGYIVILNKCKAAGITIPIIAIGGIQLNDVEKLLKTGVYGIAVSSAINGSNNISKTAREMVEKMSFELTN